MSQAASGRIGPSRRQEGARTSLAALCRAAAPAIIVIAVCLAAAGCGGRTSTQTSTSAPRGPRPVSVPLKFLGAIPMIEVRVGNGPKVPVVLDTGSTGLQIFEPGVRTGTGSGVALSSQPESVGYAGGGVLSGVMASGKLTIGHLKTRFPVRFGL